MKPSSPQIEEKYLVEISWADRWLVYQRLRELDIPCSCETDKPLQVEINTPTAAIQLWSVVRQFTSSRQDLIWSLKRIWQSRYSQS
ncbi:Asr1405/Asl0597 family protein [Nostoc sp. TCL26-01]|uniref:Asr1405/Asl0597 family protein n=1 Tax=Nostoc sp. TCL26-01 TaxID=2576904 RepID=UPI0015B82C17|nr:Asr1405/Asl0597 family protein [Nostoc sp. TCL26-01]QLE54327.1 hypothetical protein FD725_01525 [Nostoc sp. TCL26-01]